VRVFWGRVLKEKLQGISMSYLEPYRIRVYYIALYTSSKFSRKDLEAPGNLNVLFRSYSGSYRIRVYYIALYTSSKFSRKDLEAPGNLNVLFRIL